MSDDTQSNDTKNKDTESTDTDSDNEILRDFQDESKQLILDMIQILENIEEDFTRVRELENYAQIVDRIMGGAKSIAVGFPPEHCLFQLADYAALCKAVGYKASQISDNEEFYRICVLLLLDASEMLADMMEQLINEEIELKELIGTTFVDRLRWVSGQFDSNVRESVAVPDSSSKKMNQSEIDDLLKKLGLG